MIKINIYKNLKIFIINEFIKNIYNIKSILNYIQKIIKLKYFREK